MAEAYHIAIGPVLQSKLPPGDPYWITLNGSFKNTMLSQDMVASELYDGHAITTCCDPQWRKADNFQCGQHIGLDFDTEDKRSTIPALMKDSFVAKYASIIYTTPSHTPEKPRARVIFLLDAPIYQAKNYTLATSSLLWIFGTADRQCKDPVRFFYGGKPGEVEMEWLGNELPLALMHDLITRYQSTGNATRKIAQRKYEPGTTDEHKITNALQHLDPWKLNYDEWVNILMALHSELGDAGLSMALSWADGKPNEVEQKWRGFNANGNASGRVGIGTLFALAKQHGWKQARD
jgi:hypothetical protein